jgi:hypothetical protein
VEESGKSRNHLEADRVEARHALQRVVHLAESDLTCDEARRAQLLARDGADTIVWLATLPDGGPKGGFFRDRRAIEW